MAVALTFGRRGMALFQSFSRMRRLVGERVRSGAGSSETLSKASLAVQRWSQQLTRARKERANPARCGPAGSSSHVEPKTEKDRGNGAWRNLERRRQFACWQRAGMINSTTLVKSQISTAPFMRGPNSRVIKPPDRCYVRSRGVVSAKHLCGERECLAQTALSGRVGY